MYLSDYKINSNLVGTKAELPNGNQLYPVYGGLFDDCARLKWADISSISKGDICTIQGVYKKVTDGRQIALVKVQKQSNKLIFVDVSDLVL